MAEEPKRDSMIEYWHLCVEAHGVSPDTLLATFLATSPCEIDVERYRSAGDDTWSREGGTRQ